MKNYRLYIAFLLLISILCVFVSLQFKSVSDEKYLTVIVERGDNLWMLGEKYKTQHSMSIPEFVDWVVRTNHLYEGKIKVGQEIRLPISEDNLQYAFSDSE
ncbi:LysM peptidoglycan-binding domain-containing protein [Bacillus sp. HMF5848]|uniref:cell division suppressor protein YneA n=1 Tax=Bacillus sp. HMF5848 TaxID=2495421 RepID=UPI000F7A4BAB|nr:LysM peptidoglycan-binding domain-containing protein [Bacillus sp. HMF5848]RSK27118.1 LysM peptidoglycan-binding domain-containing protein [Bacillus sp. HMF5848]